MGPTSPELSPLPTRSRTNMHPSVIEATQLVRLSIVDGLYILQIDIVKPLHCDRIRFTASKSTSLFHFTRKPDTGLLPAVT